MILKELKKILKRFPSEAMFTVTVNGQRIPIVASDISARMYKNGKWEFFLYKYQSDNKNIRSIYDIDDLEIWQKLANLFDLNGHKWCECDGGKIVEYYEVWKLDNSSNETLRYKKYKVPVDTKDRFTVLTYIDEQFIKKDNINPKDYEGKN